jgi:hypothetical protein
MKRIIIGGFFVLLISAPAMADATLQIYSCNLAPGHTGDEVIALSEEWLKAARTMEGGADLEVSLEFPLAASSGEGSFNFVLSAPNPAVWGVFTNGYLGSAAAEADENWEGVATCDEITLWASVDIE